MRKVPPSVRMREEFGESMEAATPEHPMRHFVRRAAELLLQTAMEEAVQDFLGRGDYERSGRVRSGWRNGYERLTVQSEAGPLGLFR